MGEHEVRQGSSDGEVRTFTQAVLNDLRAFQELLEGDMIERGVRRMGVEQEMFLVDERGRPAPLAPAVLDRLREKCFTTELALFNLEANLDPQPFEGPFLGTLERELRRLSERVNEVAADLGASVLLTGILPNFRRSDLGLHNMTPSPRYRQLNDALLHLRGESFSVFIRGLDEFEMQADSVMLESANTSLQLHLQVGPEEFPRMYNLAQLITAPLLAAAVNSPVIFGRRLWHETRVALFERSVDARTVSEQARGMGGRVSFGRGWVRGSVLELFREAATRYRTVLTREPEEDSLAAVRAGRAPKLSALMLHNGTVWRWNRACYGVAGGVPHLRIENRILPAGPTVMDEVANAALFYGLMAEMEHTLGDVADLLPFDDAKGNFLAAARHGLDANFTWLGGEPISARELLLETLVPTARRGLLRVSAPQEEVDRYLGILEERVEKGRTGAKWILESMAAMPEGTQPQARAEKVTEIMLHRQRTTEPVHTWPLASAAEVEETDRGYRTVGDIMTTDLFTVRPEDVVDLATSVMDWRHVRHVPVESGRGELVGLISHRALLRLREEGSQDPVAVETIMEREVDTVDRDMPLLAGMRHLLAGASGCLLVVTEGRLVGIATERDFLRAAAGLLDRPRGDG
jgi:CBS domain-containing protein/gamma-glutamyl:cysteine ligase YbdK (ATP-grasp superfamily)